jgi:lambda family phage portal protein
MIDTLLDKAINYISPKWAKDRLENRYEAQTMSGRYESASTTNAIFQEFITSTTDADSSVTWDRDRLVQRSRDNVRNVPVATGLINRICDHAIGDRGLTLHPQIDRQTLGISEEQAVQIQRNIEGEWKMFSESKEIDIERTQNFSEKTYLTLKSELEGGDCFTLLTNENRTGSPYNLKLQSLEGEFVSNPDNKVDTEKMVKGVEKDNNGAPIAYYFSRWHSGDRIHVGSNSWQRRKIFGNGGRRNILHHQNQIRFGQTRGIPILGPVTGKLVQLERLSSAELLAAVINSYYTIVVQGKVPDTALTKKAPRETTTLTADDKLTLGSGSIIRAKEGTEFKSFDPQRPNQLFEPFFLAMVAEIGAAIGVPKSLILMTFDKSYSASRGEVLLAWVYFLAKRTHVKVNFCQPVYEAFLDEAIASGRIAAPGYFSDMRIRKAYQGSAYNQWTGPTRPAIDELKEAQANAVYLGLGTQSRHEITAKTTGRDWIKVNEQLRLENELRVESGLEEPIEFEEIEDDENS